MKALQLMAASIWSPAATFAEIRTTNPRPWIPIIIHSLVGMLVAGILVSRIDLAEILLAQAAQQGNTVPEDQQEAVTSLFNSPLFAFAVSALPAIFVPLMFLLVSASTSPCF